MSALLIIKLNSSEFSFTVDGDTANTVVNMRNDLTCFGNECHFKTANGANIIRTQQILYSDVTLVAGGTFTFLSVPLLFDKLREVGYFDWIDSIGGGTGAGIDRFEDLLDTPSYFGNMGKTMIVDSSETNLIATTLYNYRNLVELEDTFDVIVPNKMLVTNATGDQVVLTDLPQTPETYLNAVGFFDYADLATQTTPLSLVPSVELTLTNDAAGAYTNLNNAPFGVGSIWNVGTSSFDFSDLSIGDTIDFRIDATVTTTAANQVLKLHMDSAIGGANPYSLPIATEQIKTASTVNLIALTQIYIGSDDIRLFPTQLRVFSLDAASIKVNGWYVRIIRKNINIIDINAVTNLSYTASPTNGIVASDVGTDATIPLADATNAGLLKPAKYTVLENTSGINTGDQDLSGLQNKLVAGTNITIDETNPLLPVISAAASVGTTNLAYAPSPTNGTVTSDTGTDATIPLADATNAGLLKPAKYTVLENTSGTNTGDQDLSGLQPKGVRITNAATTGAYALDWNAADVWELTLTGTTVISDTNLPTGTATKVIELIVKGAFSITLPAYWEATPASESYTGAKWNHYVVSCINGTAASERVIYSNEVLTT